MNYEERDPFGMYKAAGPGPDARHGPGPEIMGADTLIGNDVYNQKDEDLGDIKEIMLDMRSGRIGYAVLSFGGFLGMGEKLFAVPWNALVLDTKNKRFVLNVEKDRLKERTRIRQGPVAQHGGPVLGEGDPFLLRDPAVFGRPMRSRRAISGLALAALIFVGCGTVTGAAVGAGAGAAVGHATGYGAGKGALIGTGIGAVAGAIYDITQHDREEE